MSEPSFMREHKKNLLIFLFLCLLALAMGMIRVQDAPKDFFEGLTEADLMEERLRWEGNIEAVGVQAAYEQFKTAYQYASTDRQHALAHVFGELVYEQAGIGGVAVCDAEFGFGCFHSFFGKAIQEEGISVVKELDHACIDAYGVRGTGCSHGIGHGILSYTGEDALAEALELCSGLTFKGPIGGCSSGVFMEYNFRTMAGEESGTRPLVFAHKEEPCSGTTLFEESCYFEQPAWWRSALEQQGHNPTETYRLMGEWCRQIPTSSHEKACLWGIGHVIPANSAYDLELSMHYCNLMPDRKSEFACRTGAAWGFLQVPQHRARAAQLCTEGAREEEKKECLSEYEII